MALVQKQFSDIITYTRSSTAMEFNQTGTLVQTGVNTPRIDFDPLTLAIKGFLVEEAKTNLLTRTNSKLAWAALGAISVQLDGTRFIDGVQPMMRLVESLDLNRTVHTAQLTGVSIPADSTHTISFFAKSAGRGIRLELSNGWAAPDWPNIYVNLKDFTFTTNGGVVGAVKPMGGGMCRISLTVTRGSTPWNGTLVFRPFDDTKDVTYVGDGVSGLYIGGFQIETGTVMTSYIPSTDTFTSRSTTATYFDSNKVLKTASVNEARSLAYDWDDKGDWKPLGLLEERAATNLALQSNSATTFSSVVGASYTDVGQLFVDGVSPLRKLTETEGGSSHRGVTTETVVPANSTYTVSFVLKTAGSNSVRLSATGGGVDYNVVAMTAIKTRPADAYSATITPYGDGFVRITMTATAGSTDLPFTATVFLLSNATGGATYAGDGVSGMFIGGYQVEVGASASSYVPTTTAQVTRGFDIVASVQTTRAADVPVINEISPWYNQTEGTLYVEAIPLGVPSGIYACLNAGNLNNRLQVDSVTAGNRLTVIAGGSTQVSAVATPIPVAGQVQKIAVAFKNDDFALCSNGGTVRLDTDGTLPTMTRLSLMSATIGGQPNAHLRMIKYYPRRLTDAELQALTA